MSTILPSTGQVAAARPDYSRELIPGLPYDITKIILNQLPIKEAYQFVEARGSRRLLPSRIQVLTDQLTLQKKLTVSELRTCQKIFSYRPAKEGNLILKSWVDIAKTVNINFSSLEELDLHDDESLTDDELALIIRACPNLTHLNLGRSSEKPKRMLSDSLFDALANCPKLAKLNLEGSQGITVEKIKKLGQYCPNITVMNLNEARDIRDPIIEEIANQCPNLVAIHLCAVNDINWLQWGVISDRGLKAFAKCKNLEYISLIARDNLSDIGVCALAESCPNLVYCDMSYCKDRITEASVDTIYALCPKLQFFRLAHSTPALESMSLNNRTHKYFQHLNYQAAYDEARYSC